MARVVRLWLCQLRAAVAWPLPPESNEFLSAAALKGVATGGGSDTAAYFVRVHIVISALSQAPNISLYEQHCYVDTIHA